MQTSSRWPKCLAALATAALALTVCALPEGSALAESSAAFTAHYEHQAQVEAQLQLKVQALPDAQQARAAAVASLLAAVDASVPPLYAEEQALSAAGAEPLPAARVTQDVLTALRGARSAYAGAIRACNGAPAGSAAWRAKRAALVGAAQSADLQVAKDILAVRAGALRPLFRRSAAVQSDALQVAITDLQATAISLLDADLLLADASSATGKPAAVQGLAYSSDTITIPARGQGAVKDTVGAQPRVTDANGQVLPDTGAYRLQGPAKFRGVAVDRLIGTVTVRPNATPGAYTVTYTQGAAAEQVTLQVVP